MKIHRLFFAFFLLASPVCMWGQVQPPREVNSLLEASTAALNHWQQIASRIHCEDATQPDVRGACNIDVQAIGERVQEAKAKIARYRQQSTPQVVDLFDAYESFRRVFESVEIMNCDLYGQHNRQVSAEAYNSFVKVTAWFAGVVRTSIQNSASGQ
jgi:hypothetical protein